MRTGGQFALTALHAAQQLFLLPLQGPLLLLQRLILGAELVPLPFGPADALLQLLALLGILPGQGLQIIQHILPVKAAEDGVSELMVHGGTSFSPSPDGSGWFCLTLSDSITGGGKTQPWPSVLEKSHSSPPLFSTKTGEFPLPFH